MELMFRINFFTFKVSGAVLFLKKEHMREIVHMPGWHTIAGSRAALEKTGGR